MDLGEEILSVAAVVREVPFKRPEWKNVPLLVRELTGEERAKYDSLNAKRVRNRQDVDVSGLYVLVLTSCVLNPATRQPVFTEDQAKRLMKTSGGAVAAAVEVALAQSEIGDEEEGELVSNFSSPVPAGTGETPNSSGTSSQPVSATPSSSA